MQQPSRLQRNRRAALGVGIAAVVLVVAVVIANRPRKESNPPTNPVTQQASDLPKQAPANYRGKIDVLVERTGDDGKTRLLRLNNPGVLPLRKDDKFRIEGEVDPPAYLYVIWIDPDRDITPVYPWDPKVGWGSRTATEKPLSKIRLPSNAGNLYTAPDAKPGVSTMVLFARSTPLDVPDDEVERWFKNLPDLPLPAGGDGAAVWFDNYLEVRDPDRPRTFGEVGSDDAFARWQGELQKVLGGKAAFQTAVSFARMGGK